MNKILIIFKYLTKNYIINPFIAKHKKIFVTLAILFFVSILALIFSIYSGPSHPHNKPVLSMNIREILANYGLDKYKLCDIISLVITLIVFVPFITGRSVLWVIEEAEYEILLAQPISMKDYLVARLFFQYGREGLLYIYSIWIIPFIFDIVYGSVTRLVIFFISLYILLFIVSALSYIVTLINIYSEARGKRYIPRLLASIYLLIGAIDSIIIFYPSPIFTYPFKFLAELLIYPLAMSINIIDIIYPLLGSLSTIIPIYLIIVYLSRYFTPEYVKPISIIRRERMIKGVGRFTPKISFKTGSDAIKSYIFNLSIFNYKHIRNISLAIIISIASSFIFKNLLSRYPLNFISTSDIPFISSFIIPFYISIALAGIISRILSNDLSSFWIYRVYSINMKNVARWLIIKYSVYFIEAYIVIAVIDTIFTYEYIRLLLPISLLPITVILSLVSLAAVTYFASKRRVVKIAPTGLYTLEELVLTIIMLFTITLILSSKIGFDITIKLFWYRYPTVIIISLIISLIMTLALYYISIEILDKLMKRYDIIG